MTSRSPPGKHIRRARRPAVDEENAAAANGRSQIPTKAATENDFGYAGPRLREMLSNRLWFRGEALLWWTRGGQTPPLLTTSPGSTPQAQAGVLGQPNTTILFGDQN